MAALVRSTVLIAKGDLVKLTGISQLLNLEAAGAGNLDLADVVLTAHESIFDRVESALGTDRPAQLTNAERLKATIAWEAIKLLALGDYLGGGPTPEQAQAEVDRRLGDFRPQYADSADAPRHGREGVPAVLSFEPGYVFGPLEAETANPVLWDDVPGRR